MLLIETNQSQRERNGLPRKNFSERYKLADIKAYSTPDQKADESGNVTRMGESYRTKYFASSIAFALKPP
jgi:hypothetical protein